MLCLIINNSWNTRCMMRYSEISIALARRLFWFGIWHNRHLGSTSLRAAHHFRLESILYSNFWQEYYQITIPKTLFGWKLVSNCQATVWMLIWYPPYKRAVCLWWWQSLGKLSPILSLRLWLGYLRKYRTHCVMNYTVQGDPFWISLRLVIASFIVCGFTAFVSNRVRYG